jgi:hypothetical protein
MEGTYTVWGDEYSALLTSVPRSQAEEFIKSSDRLDLYMENDQTGTGYVWEPDTQKWREE